MRVTILDRMAIRWLSEERPVLVPATHNGTKWKWPGQQAGP